MAPCSIFGVALLMLACGQGSGDNSGSSSSSRENEQIGEGRIYKSQLLPLNTIVAGTSIGHLQWSVGPSLMKVHLAMTNTPESLEHYQAIHSGSRCPTESADSNSDGIIDMEELQKVSGQVLFPLDSDLTSTQRGDFSTSRSNEYGNYVYSGEMSIRQIRSIASNFSPENKVVVVYGINQNYGLPSSTFTPDGNKHRYIPISCGVIKTAPVQNLY